MIHLSLYLRCECGERWLVGADNLEEFKFWSFIDKVDYANHVTGHNVERILENIKHG